MATRAVAGRPNVLITSAARKVLLVRAFRDALIAVGGGGRVLAADVDPWSVAVLEADGSVDLPGTADPAFAEAIEEACEREDIGLVVPTRDGELSRFAELRERLAERGTVVLVSGPDAIATCRDKRRFAEAVVAAGLDTPRIRGGPEYSLPAFVKPRFGAGSRFATTVRTDAELASAVAAIEASGGEPIVQEFVDGTELTIDVFIDLDGRAISCVPRERLQVVAGESVVSRTIRDADVSAATLRLCGSLSLVGHLTVQCLRTPDRIAFLEINPRYGGAANLGFAAGARTPEFAVRLSRDEPLLPRLDDYEVGLVMLRYSEDRFVRAAIGPPPGHTR